MVEGNKSTSIHYEIMGTRSDGSLYEQPYFEREIFKSLEEASEELNSTIYENEPRYDTTHWKIAKVTVEEIKQ